MWNRSKILTVFAVINLTFLCATPPLKAVLNGNQAGGPPILMPGRLEVQFESDVNADKLATSFGKVSFGIPTLDRALESINASEAIQMFPWRRGEKALVGNDDMSRFYELIFSEDLDISVVIDELLRNPYIRSVSPVYAIPVDGITPNDPDFIYQWGLKKIDDTLAWELEKGSDTVKIAIIDTGVLYSHPDLRDNIWVNPGEDLDGDMVVFDTDDSNNIDNDGNYVDDLIGWDFFSGFSGVTCEDADCYLPDNNPIDYNGHGTHVAGIAAEVSNNALGGAGVAGGWGGGLGPHAGPRIICLRVGASGYHPDYGHTGFVNSANCAQAVDYAAATGAHFINASWGMSQSTAMTNALKNAHSMGLIVCHAAGNDGSPSGSYYDTWSPPDVGHKLVVSVAWTNSNDTKNYWSNYGWWVDVCAPGSGIYSTYSSHYVATYASISGTSMAAPHVVGLAALIKSHMPDYTRDEILPLILDNADEMPGEPLWLSGQLGSGRINAYKALDSLPTATFSAGPVLLSEAPLEVNFTDESPHSPTSWTWDFGDTKGAVGDPNPSHTYTEYGLYDVSLTVDDDFGTGTDVLKNVVMVTADSIKIGSATAPPNTEIVIPIYLDNKYKAKRIIFPFKIRRPNGTAPGNSYLFLDSVSVVGLRTEYFEEIKEQYWDQTGKRFTIILRPNVTGGSDYLEPDTGAILNLHLTMINPPINEVLTIEDTTLSGRSLEIESIVYDYVPVLVPGQINAAVCDRGDANWDISINLLDVTYLINYLYKSGSAPVSVYCGDANASGNINILDVTYLINYLYKGGPPPPP